MSASAPGSSGAMVMTRSPSSNGASCAGSTPSGARRWRGSWAPLRASAMNGPSRLKPSGAAPSSGASGRHVRTLSAKRASTSSGALTAVGRKDVTPCRSSARAMPSRAALPPIASWPPQPCTWTSTNPGAMNGPSAAAASGSMAAMSPSSMWRRPGATELASTSRPDTLATVRRRVRPAWRGCATAVPGAVGGPVPRPRSRPPAHSGRPGSAIRWPPAALRAGPG